MNDSNLIELFTNLMHGAAVLVLQVTTFCVVLAALLLIRLCVNGLRKQWKIALSASSPASPV